jgi:hypothetical protein
MALDQRLARQSLGRSLTEAEQAFARDLEAVFAEGVHDFGKVAIALDARSCGRPSGKPGPWSEAILQEELAALNASLDAAYADHGLGA